MTKQEVLDQISANLQVPVTDIQKVIDSFGVTLDFITESDISDIIPDWAAGLTFNTDGSGAGKYCKHPDTNGKKRVFETLTDANIGNEPPTDPNIASNANWSEISQAGGSGIKEWAAGIYGNGLIIVYHNHSEYGPGLAKLTVATRPFNSTNIEYEIGIGQWEWIGVKDVNISQHVTLTDGAAVTWDLKNKKLSTASLVTTQNAINLTIQNLVSGTHHTLIIKKNNSANLVITPLYAGLQVHKVGETAPAATITLQGDAGKVFKLDFSRLEVTEGLVLQGDTGGDSNTKIVALSASTFVAAMKRYIKKSIDSGANWTIEHDTGSDNDFFNSMSFSGSNGLAAHYGRVWKTSDGGDTWSHSTFLDGTLYVLRVDANVGYVARRHGTTDRVYKSTDGCNNFSTSVALPSAPYSICKGGSDNVIYVGHSNGGIRKSIDSGATFNPVPINGVTFRVDVLRFLTDDFGLSGGANASLYKTMNGGGLWTQVVLPAEIGTVEDVGIIDTNKFIVAGSGGVAYTVDGGNTFVFKNSVVGFKGATVFDADDIFLLKDTGETYEYTIAAASDLLFVVDTNEGGGAHFRGYYVSLAALQAAHPSAFPGDYAIVDTGVGTDAKKYIWDDDDDAWVLSSGSPVPDASETVEGVVEEATDAEMQAGTGAGGTGARLFVNPGKLSTWWTWVKTQAATITGAWVFSALRFRNIADTFTSIIQNAATAARTYTFPDRNITVAGVDDFVGIQDLFIPAAAMWPRVTSGCAPLARTEIATSLVNIQSLDFDATAQEFAQFVVSLPRNWNNGTIKVKAYWTAASGSGNVEWGFKAGAYSNDDALSTALGAEQVVIDTLITAYDIHVTAESPEITVGGSPADADLIVIQVSRNPASASDTLNADAKLLGIVATLTTDAGVAA